MTTASTAYVPPVSLPDPAELSASNPHRDPRKVAQEFESVFISMMLKSMRESMSKEMFAGDNSDTFGGMFDSIMGQHIAQQGGLGMAEMILAAGLPGTSNTNDLAKPSSDAGATTESSNAIKVYENAAAGA